jgi:hypothetical protein
MDASTACSPPLTLNGGPGPFEVSWALGVSSSDLISEIEPLAAQGWVPANAGYNADASLDHWAMLVRKVGTSASYEVSWAAGSSSADLLSEMDPLAAEGWLPVNAGYISGASLDFWAIMVREVGTTASYEVDWAARSSASGLELAIEPLAAEGWAPLYVGYISGASLDFWALLAREVGTALNFEVMWASGSSSSGLINDIEPLAAQGWVPINAGYVAGATVDYAALLTREVGTTATCEASWALGVSSSDLVFELEPLVAQGWLPINAGYNEGAMLDYWALLTRDRVE